MIINRANLDFLNTAYRADFQRGFAGVTPMWQRFATRVPSSTSKNVYAWLNQFPKFREWVGDRVVKSLSADGYEIANKSYEATVGVKRDAIDDDQWNVYGPMMEMMGNAASTFPDDKLFDLVKNGFATKCFDGQYFFDTDHPVGEPGSEVSVSNFQGGAGAGWFLLDLSRPLKPFIVQERRKTEFVFKVDAKTSDDVFNRAEYVYGADRRDGFGYGFWQMAYGSRQAVTTDNIKAAIQAMTVLKAHNGEFLGIKPQVMLCGPSTYWTAHELINMQFLAAGASNPLYKVVEVVQAPWLD